MFLSRTNNITKIWRIIFAKLQISEEEIEFLTGGDDPYDDDVVMKKLYHPNLKLLVVTEGAAGCRYYTKVNIHVLMLTLILNLLFTVKSKH